jgi:hypothetical protein
MRFVKAYFKNPSKKKNGCQFYNTPLYFIYFVELEVKLARYTCLNE